MAFPFMAMRTYSRKVVTSHERMGRWPNVMASSSGEWEIGYVTLDLGRHVTSSCERFDRRLALLTSCREGGRVAADVKNVKKICSSRVMRIMRLVMSRRNVLPGR